MKKHLLIALVVLSLVTALVGIAAASMDVATARLLAVDFTHGRVLFTFKVLTGQFSVEDLEGVMVVDGQNYDLRCRYAGGDIVKCTSTKKAEKHTVTLYWGGAMYTAKVPDQPSPSYCYDIWDYWGFTGDEWTNFGPHCQDDPAQEGDMILYDVPDPGGLIPDSPAWFENSPACGTTPDHGPAYYWNDC